MDQQHSDEMNAEPATANQPPVAQESAPTPAANDVHSAEGQPAEERTIGRGRWIAGAAAALGVALFAVPFLRGPEPPAGTSSSTGDVASSGATCSTSKGAANFDFTLKDMNGADVRLSDFKGKVILLNFWATWCGPCKVEIPEFVAAYNEYRDRGFVILGVLSQDDPPADDLRAFANDWGMKYPILREHAELDEAFGPMWAIPTSFIIDRQGSICTKHLGPVPKDVLEREIERLL